MKIKGLLFSVIVFFVSLSWAAKDLVIHTSEFGVGKFHRYDNKVHSYASTSAWLPYVLADGVPTDKILTQKNADGSYTIFYSHLEEMIQASIDIAKRENKKISVLNVHGHGLPGGMWFPADESTLQSSECASWRETALGEDKANYDQYYSPISKAEIMQIRQMSNLPNVGAFAGCITGLTQWNEVVNRNSEIRDLMETGAQIHFASCVVGLGKAGDTFTKGIAALMLPRGGNVVTSVNFGLGDWSMPEGMGFWDYQSDSQIKKDNQDYVTNKTDRNIMQKGTMRVASYQAGWKTQMIGDQDFMSLAGSKIRGPRVIEQPMVFAGDETILPERIRIPGTHAFVERK